jgi:hypothetical protein
VGFEPTAVRGKWFEVNDFNNSSTDAPQFKDVELNDCEFIKNKKPYKSYLLDLCNGFALLLNLKQSISRLRDFNIQLQKFSYTGMSSLAWLYTGGKG